MTRGWREPSRTSITSIMTVMNSQLIDTKVIADGASTVASEVTWRAGRARVRDVAAIELAERQQVQRSREHAEPRGERHRVDVDVSRGQRAEHQPRADLKQQRLAQASRLKSAAAGTTFESIRPKKSAGTSTTNPAIGPATPMSNSAASSGTPRGCGSPRRASP